MPQTRCAQIQPTEPTLTTIAVHSGCVAVDSQTTGGNYACRMQKLVRLPDGGVAAMAGAVSNGYAALKWLSEGERGDGPDIEGAVVVIVRPDQSIWIADGCWPAFPILDDSYASGCGQDLARKAMADGKDPVQAVAEACELDAFSSGPIFAMRVLPPRPDPGVEIYEVTANRKPRKARK
jgi:hypothetical protein